MQEREREREINKRFSGSLTCLQYITLTHGAAILGPHPTHKVSCLRTCTAQPGGWIRPRHPEIQSQCLYRLRYSGYYKVSRRRRRRRRRRRNWSCTTFQHYVDCSSHYIHTVIVYTGKERRNRNQIQRDMEFHHSHPGSFKCPEYCSDVQDRRPLTNTMDIFESVTNIH